MNVKIGYPKLENNLLSWGKINRYSKWMYNIFAPFVGKRVVDIGAGVGNMMQFYIDNAELVVATDVFESQLSVVEERFKEKTDKTKQLVTLVLDVEKMNPLDFVQYSLDTVISINVLEHIEDDLLALNNMKNILPSGGVIILLVPAHSRLYNRFDKNAGHHRRYDKGQLSLLAEKLDMRVLKNRYFNFFGILPYYFKGKFGRQKKDDTFSSSLGEINSRFYNMAACILEPIERAVAVPCGLSELIVLEKK